MLLRLYSYRRLRKIYAGRKRVKPRRFLSVGDAFFSALTKALFVFSALQKQLDYFIPANRIVHKFYNSVWHRLCSSMS
jgi:hypothetical protein